MKTLFVGNLAAEITEEELSALFSEYGKVRNVVVPRDIFSGRNKGFGFIDMEGHEARAAMAGLNGKLYREKNLKIREEDPKKKGRGRRR
jgi:RNA recognition motif-containing protein